MKVIDQFKNKKVLVLGLAKSGESAARLLDKLGAIVTVNDGKPFEDNPAAQSLLEEGIGRASTASVGVMVSPTKISSIPETAIKFTCFCFLDFTTFQTKETEEFCNTEVF